jgi:hypothetical protein
VRTPAIEPSDPTALWPLADAPARPGEVEICGFAAAAADSPAARAMALQAQAQIGAAADKLFAAMDRSPDPRTRAAALLARDEREPLAAMARLTSDPTVYAMALQACHRDGANPGHSGAASCAALSAQQLARLDPDNVAPWLWLAAEALQRNDTQGVAEAVYRASLARESRLREFGFADLALSALPADWPPREAMLAGARVLEIHAALALPSYVAVVQHCAKERMQDANLQQTCERLARVLTQRGDTLVDYGIGRRLGERAGWSADVVELHSARLEAYKQTMADGDTLVAGLAESKACHALRRDVRLAYAHARHGERAHVQGEVERLGLSDAVMIERYRAAQSQRPPAPAGSAPR